MLKIRKSFIYLNNNSESKDIYNKKIKIIIKFNDLKDFNEMTQRKLNEINDINKKKKFEIPEMLTIK